MKNKKNIILLSIIIIIIVVISVITFIFLKKKNDNTNNTSTSKDKFATYYSKVSNVLKEDNILKQLFYSNPDITEELVTFENKTYYGLSDKYNIKDVSEIYTKINKTYTINYKKKLFNDINNYNSFANYNNKVYINIKKKCFIENYDEKLLSIKNVENENITYIYDKKEYVVSFWDDIYLIDSSPFSC